MGMDPAQFRVMEERLARNRRKTPPAPAPELHPAVTPIPPSQCAMESSDIVFSCVDRYRTHEFVFHGKPIGKPRMTQRDKFIKRPIVQRYWTFKAALQAACGPTDPNADMVIVTAWVPMPPSWSKKKQDAMAGQPCRQKPDWDNISKAICDALFDDDECIWVGVAIKYWCRPGDERLNVKILYAKS